MPRIRINLAQRELEIEGDEAFVARYLDTVDEMLVQLRATAPVAAPALAEVGRLAGDSFGEFLHALPDSCTDVDRMLMAGWFVQRLSSDNSFATGDANRYLSEQGVKVGNPSQSVKQNLVAKRAFLVGRGRYRVSQTGTQHLNQLTGGRLDDG